MVLVVVDEQVNDLGPVLQGLARTNKEVLLVKDMQDLILKLLQEYRLLLHQCQDQLTRPLHRQIFLFFVLHQRQHRQYHLLRLLHHNDLTFVVQTQKEIIAYSLRDHQTHHPHVLRSLLAWGLLPI